MRLALHARLTDDIPREVPIPNAGNKFVLLFISLTRSLSLSLSLFLSLSVHDAEFPNEIPGNATKPTYDRA